MLTRKKSPSSKALTMLRRKLPGRVYTDTSSCYEASLDNLRLSFLPDAVVKVKQAQDIGILLKLAHSNGIAVTPRGAGSSTTGSAVPVNGGWVLDVSALKSIRIDTVSKIATVGAGVVTHKLQQRAAARGLFFPPDPSSKKYSTIGGNIA